MSLGFDRATFWTITPRELMALRQGAVKRLRRDFNSGIRLAHLTAKLTAYAPAKGASFVKLETLLISDEPMRQQTPDEQIAIAKQWTAAVAARTAPGGKVG